MPVFRLPPSPTQLHPHITSQNLSRNPSQEVITSSDIVSRLFTGLRLWLENLWNSPYKSTILADTPVTYYRMDSTGNTETDLGSQGNNATFSNSSRTQGQLGAIDDGDTSVYFPSGGADLASGANASLGTGARTLEGWIKGTPSGGWGVAIASKDFELAVYSTNSICIFYNGEANIVSTTTPNSIVLNDGNWHYLVATWDGTHINFYVDGIAATGNPFTPSPALSLTTLGIVAVGAGAGNGGYYGTIDEVAFYNYALSQTQVTKHYSSSGTKNPLQRSLNQLSQILENLINLNYRTTILNDNPVLYYGMDSTTTTETDLSTNGNNGTYSSPYTQAQAGGVSYEGNSVYFGIGGLLTSGSGTNIPSGNSSWSQEFWLKKGTGGFFTMWGNTGGSGYNELYLPDGVSADLFYNNQGNQVVVAYGPKWDNDGQWHHIVHTFDGSNWRFYLDGVQQGTAQALTLNSGTGTIKIGGVGNNASGWIDEFAMYNTVLNITQIQKHFNQGVNLNFIFRVVTQAGALNEAILNTDLVNRLSLYGRQVLETLSIADALTALKGGSNNLLRTISDTISDLDTVNRLVNYLRLFSPETISIIDSIGRQIAFSRVQYEAISTGDLLSRFVQNTRIISSDVLSLVDLFIRSETISRLAQENISTSDLVTRTLNNLRSLLESNATADTLNRLSVITRNLPVVITLGTADLLLRTATSNRGYSEQYGEIDALNRIVQTLRVNLETLSIQDLISRIEIVARSNLETYGETDSLLKLAKELRTSSENISIQDLLLRFVNILRSNSEIYGEIDSLNRIEISLRTNIETLTVQDALNKLSLILRSVLENYTEVDSLSRLVFDLRTNLETMSTQDIFNRLVYILRTNLETLTIIDSTPVKFITKAITEAILETDTVVRSFFGSRNLQEIATVNDLIFRFGNISRTVSEALSSVDTILRLVTNGRLFQEVYQSIDLLNRSSALNRFPLEVINASDMLIRASFMGFRTISEAVIGNNTANRFVQQLLGTSLSIIGNDNLSRLEIAGRQLGESQSLVDVVLRLTNLSRLSLEAATNTDILSKLQSNLRLALEAIVGADNINRLVRSFRTPQESYTYMDLLYALTPGKFLATLKEAILSTDTLNRMAINLRLVSEAVLGTNATNTLRARFVSLNETTGVVDTTLRTVVMGRIVLETVAASMLIGANQVIGRTLSDLYSDSDLIKRLTNANRATNETILIADTLIGSIVYLFTIVTIMGETDQANRLLGLLKTSSETIVGQDLTNRTINISRSILETIVSSPIIAVIQNLFKNAIETYTSNDTIRRLTTVNRVISETTSIIDALVPSGLHAVTFIVNMAIIDQSSRLQTASRTGVESIVGVDSTQRLIVAWRAISEASSVIDTVSSTGAFVRTLLSVISGSDILTRTAWQTGLINETETVADLVDRSQTSVRQTLETLGLVSTFATIIGTIRTNVDAILSNDYTTRMVQYNRSNVIVVTIGDTLSVIRGVSKTIAETIGITDFLNSSRSFYRTIIDIPTTIGDQVNRRINIIRQVSQSVISIVDIITGLYQSYINKPTSVTLDFVDPFDSTFTFIDPFESNLTFSDSNDTLQFVGPFNNTLYFQDYYSTLVFEDR